LYTQTFTWQGLFLHLTSQGRACYGFTHPSDP
jgi:hypothetical protein